MYVYCSSVITRTRDIACPLCLERRRQFVHLFNSGLRSRAPIRFVIVLIVLRWSAVYTLPSRRDFDRSSWLSIRYDSRTAWHTFVVCVLLNREFRTTIYRMCRPVGDSIVIIRLHVASPPIERTVFWRARDSSETGTFRLRFLGYTPDVNESETLISYGFEHFHYDLSLATATACSGQGDTRLYRLWSWRVFVLFYE